jgi:sphinganine-1-phosphate aldolase
MLETICQIVVAYVCVVTALLFVREGPSGVIKALMKQLKTLPGMNTVIHAVLAREVQAFVRQMDEKTGIRKKIDNTAVRIPVKGIPRDQLLRQMHELKGLETNVEDGLVFAYVYTGEGDHFDCIQKAYDLFSEGTGAGEQHDCLVKEFSGAFLHENALNPMVFPALRKFETEAVAMTANMLNGDDQVVGFLTSGMDLHFKLCEYYWIYCSVIVFERSE